MKTIKFLLMGDKGVGKSSLQEAYLWKLNFGCVYHDHLIEDQRYLIDVIELTVVEELQEHFTDNHQFVNIFLVCFNVTERKTLLNARNEWILEILKLDPKAKIFLVGLQCDLREQFLTKLTQDCVSQSDGINVCLYYQNVHYLECSSIKLQSVQEVFDEALNMTLYVEDESPDEKVVELYEKMQISFKFNDCSCE